MSKRPFTSIMENDLTIMKNWNKTVTNLDKVFVLGDVSFYGKGQTKQIVRSLNGEKILLLGNHDTSKSNKWWMDVGFKDVIERPFILNTKREFKINMEKLFVLSHMPITNVCIGDLLNVHGHIHDKEIGETLNKHFNVSVENIDYTPISIKEILKMELM